jgi:hypothetical protein
MLTSKVEVDASSFPSDVHVTGRLLRRQRKEIGTEIRTVKSIYETTQTGWELKLLGSMTGCVDVYYCTWDVCLLRPVKCEIWSFHGDGRCADDNDDDDLGFGVMWLRLLPFLFPVLYNLSTSKHHQFSPVDGDSMFLRNADIDLRISTVPAPPQIINPWVVLQCMSCTTIIVLYCNAWVVLQYKSCTAAREWYCSTRVVLHHVSGTAVQELYCNTWVVLQYKSCTASREWYCSTRVVLYHVSGTAEQELYCNTWVVLQYKSCTATLVVLQYKSCTATHEWLLL